jgi:hypothetical protein
MGLIDEIRNGTYDPGPPEEPARWPTRVGVSLVRTAERIVAEGEIMPPVRDFLDQVGRVEEDVLERAIADEPMLTGHPEADALLAGVAEHLAATRGLACPRWVLEPERFLDRMWFVSTVPGFRAISIAQSPIALKRRGVFWPARSLVRV